MLIGFIRRGSLHRLGEAPLRYSYLFLLPIVIFAGVYTAAGVSGDLRWVPYVRVANIGQYMVLVIAILLNLRIRHMWMAGVGTFLNFLAVAANGGVMPISEKAIRIAGLTELLSPERTTRFVRHAIMTPETRLKLLTDVIPIPAQSIVFSEVVSIGDVMIAIAVFIIVQVYMCAPAPTR